MKQPRITIAIDGFSSCGKSTLARELARRLHYSYIDSGAMYRAITLYFIRGNVNPMDEPAVAAALKEIRIEFVPNTATGQSDILLNGENVSLLIREMVVAEKVSEVAAVPAVRHFAVAQQQAMGRRKGIVMDGRDIGTVVFPDAELKIFMTADPAIRVVRRFEELRATNPNITMEEVQANLTLRDYIDSNREESPLRQAPDARVLDNSHISREEQLDLALQWVEEAVGAAAEAK